MIGWFMLFIVYYTKKIETMACATAMAPLPSLDTLRMGLGKSLQFTPVGYDVGALVLPYPMESNKYELSLESSDDNSDSVESSFETFISQSFDL